MQANIVRQLKVLDSGHLGCGHFDIGLMTGPVLHEGTLTRDIQTDRLMVILPGDHQPGPLDRLTLQDMADLPFMRGNGDSWGKNGHRLRH